MEYSSIIFFDSTCNKNHVSIKNIGIGASEYQFYNLLQKISSTSTNSNKIIRCLNTSNENNNLIDNINYSNIQSINNFEINKNNKIIIQRFFPYDKFIREKLSKFNKIFLWIHDIPEINIFTNNNDKIIKYFENNTYEFKKFLIQYFIKVTNIYFIFNSNHCKNMFDLYLKKFNLSIPNNRKSVIYNILYSEEFIDIRKKNTIINTNQLVYASAWQKGIQTIIELFKYIIEKDNSFVLILMTPGYDMNKYIDYKKQLENLFPKNIIIYEALNKIQYGEIIKSSLCVLSSTFNETFGCVFAESYFLGTPVIADIRCGAVKEIIDNNYIVNYDNPKEVFEKIITLKQKRNELNIELDKKFSRKVNLLKWMKLLFTDKK